MCYVHLKAYQLYTDHSLWTFMKNQSSLHFPAVNITVLNLTCFLFLWLGMQGWCALSNGLEFKRQNRRHITSTEQEALLTRLKKIWRAVCAQLFYHNMEFQKRWLVTCLFNKLNWTITAPYLVPTEKHCYYRQNRQEIVP